MTTRILPTLTLTALLLAATITTYGEDRPELYGFAPAYPTATPSFSTDLRAPLVPRETGTTVRLHIDSEGMVSSLETDTAEPWGLAAYVEPYLENLTFHPALFRGEPVASILPVEVALRPGKRIPSFEFPLDTAAHAGDGRLYRATLPLNDITEPSVVRFPPYFGAPNVDTTAMYRYLLMAVDLDATGRYRSARTVLNTYPAFAAQLRAALLWSKFKPAEVKGEKVPSMLYVLVSFFGTVGYPTSQWPPDSSDRENLLELLRVRSYGDGVGLMSPPIPKNYPHDSYGLGPDYPLRRDTLYTWIEIDSTGRARPTEVDPTHSEISAAVRSIVPQCDFYPAIDFQGRPVRYRGRVALEFNGTPNVRIRFPWLWPAENLWTTP